MMVNFLRLSVFLFFSIHLSLWAQNSPSTVHLIEKGQAVKLNQHELLGDQQNVDGTFALRSAKPGTSDEFGSHYISIGMLGDVILAPGDFEISLRMGLVKISENPEPVFVNVKIGSHWYEFAFVDNQVVFQGVLWDTVHRVDASDRFESTGKCCTLSERKQSAAISESVWNGKACSGWPPAWTIPRPRSASKTGQSPASSKR